MLVVLQDGGHGATDGQAAAVEGMHQPVALTLPHPYGGAPRLEITAVAAAADLPVGSGTGHPHLQVVGARCRKAQIARAELHHPVGQLQGLQHRFRIRRELLMGRFGFVRMHKPVELHLVELVQADQTAGIAAVAARLAAEAGGVGHVAQGQVVAVQNLAPVERRERHFGGGREPEVVVRAAEALLRKLGQLPRTGEARGVHQHRRLHLPVALTGVQIQHETDQGPLQPRTGAQQGHEAATGNACGAFRLEQTQPFAQLPVLQQDIAPAWLTLTTHLLVIRLAAAVGAIGRRQVGNLQQCFPQLLLQLLFLFLQRRYVLLHGVALLSQGPNLGTVGCSTTANQLAYILADAVALRLQGRPLLRQLVLPLRIPLQGADIKLHAPA